jgi:Ca2+-binding RTX toxin-like protein
VADDGTPSLSDTKTIIIAVKPAALVNGDLLVGGTAGNDTITVAPSKDGSHLVVSLNKAVVGNFLTTSVTGFIEVHGLSGNDAISVSSKVHNQAWLFGEAGNDKLTGGGGNNLLVGGDGNDPLTTAFGTNVLIGGTGADKLTGGAGDDLLIAGPTAFDADPAGLATILSEWTGGNSYATKVANLTAGVNGTMLTAATVSDDGLKDTLSGKKGSDWFLASATDKVTDLDPKLGEVKTVI